MLRAGGIKIPESKQLRKRDNLVINSNQNDRDQINSRMTQSTFIDEYNSRNLEER
jgi:hypothetical protein